jgi:hypothetical protein
MNDKNKQKPLPIIQKNKRCKPIPININDQAIIHSNTAKYLGMTLDAKLHWKARVRKEREELGLKYKKIGKKIGPVDKQ